jgi:hypothetical protein
MFSSLCGDCIDVILSFHSFDYPTLTETETPNIQTIFGRKNGGLIRVVKNVSFDLTPKKLCCFRKDSWYHTHWETVTGIVSDNEVLHDISYDDMVYCDWINNVASTKNTKLQIQTKITPEKTRGYAWSDPNIIHEELVSPLFKPMTHQLNYIHLYCSDHDFSRVVVCCGRRVLFNLSVDTLQFCKSIDSVGRVFFDFNKLFTSGDEPFYVKGFMFTLYLTRITNSIKWKFGYSNTPEATANKEFTIRQIKNVSVMRNEDRKLFFCGHCGVEFFIVKLGDGTKKSNWLKKFSVNTSLMMNHVWTEENMIHISLSSTGSLYVLLVETSKKEIAKTIEKNKYGCSIRTQQFVHGLITEICDIMFEGAPVEMETVGLEPCETIQILSSRKYETHRFLFEHGLEV